MHKGVGPVFLSIAISRHWAKVAIFFIVEIPEWLFRIGRLFFLLKRWQRISLINCRKGSEH